MCGIAGIAGAADEHLVRKMLAITQHRGPNDSGTYAARGQEATSCVTLGNNRLSIIDLSTAGHQPMCNEDGTVWIAYNGEIYNFAELRQELVGDGHHFKSRTDTEVLVHLYEKYGRNMVKRLNGMFAFALWDANSEELMLARDRTGIKPLYYTRVGERLYFASEIKALLLCPEVEAELDADALQQYLAYLYVPNPLTMLKGVYKLPPAHILSWRRGICRIEIYWKAHGRPFHASEQALAENLRELLMKTVRRQLISDVPVGFFLSGGLDSSTLLACAAQTHDATLRCYSIAYKQKHARLEQSGDDAYFARLVSAHFGAAFHQIEVDPDVATLLPKAVWHLDDLVADPAAIATLLICKAAASEVSVLLSGQGADEVFGGYRLYRAHTLNAFWRFIPCSIRTQVLPGFMRWLAAHSNNAVGISPGLLLGFCRYSEKILRASAFARREQFVALRSYLGEHEQAALLSPDVCDKPREGSYASALLQHFEEVRGEDFVNQMLYVDGKTFLPDLNLAYSDKMSMAASVEVRVPFLDNEVLDFALQLPPSMKIKGLKLKHILYKAMDGILPKQVLERRKAAFGLPIRSWLRYELRDMLNDMLSEHRLRRRGLLNPEVVSRMIRENEQGKRDYSLPLWALLSLEIWLQAFLDRNAPCSTSDIAAMPTRQSDGQCGSPRQLSIDPPILGTSS